MKRKITQKLVEWKNQTKNRLPLILHGARQVGKTFILEELGATQYKNTVYINFEQTPSFKSVFDGDLVPERIIHLLEVATDQSIVPGETLIILDEIQTCERALTSLKYFAESADSFHIVAAGSLLGIAIHRENASFPVGKVRMEALYPLDFEEYLWALGKESLAEEIRHAFEGDLPLVDILHEQALDLYKNYLCTGGMPVAVGEYAETRRLSAIPQIQTNILNAYVADMVKYATSSESVKIRNAFDSIPAQLAKENRKFQYKLLKKGASAAHFGAAIDWLCSSGVVLKCRRIEQGKMPPAAYVDLNAFKLYLSDIGLLLAKSGIPIQTVLLASENSQDFRGSLAENYAAQALTAAGHDLFYWESSSQAEVDFVIVRDEAVIPVEVKSAMHSRSKSLGVYVERYQPPYAIRLSTRNFGFENKIKSIPLYAAFLI
ncbi:MAG: ATP-binding protein [Desulfobacteraceae bacterium]|nr:MAG: ATP-binding protein [Desulfobacteraceae bacterium]